MAERRSPSRRSGGADIDRPRIAFAGDRQVAVDVLDLLLGVGVQPLALLLPTTRRASHHAQLLDRCADLAPSRVLRGPEFREPAGVELLGGLGLDLVVSVHFPFLVPPAVLALPRRGWLNLHPAYLPFNRGWHTASWAILEGTPLGATLHYMDEGIDTGPIVHQRRLEVGPADTAATLYPRLFALEVEVFRQGWAMVADRGSQGTPQAASGTAHLREDLLGPSVQQLDLDQLVPTRDLLRRLRALTTSRVDEAAYFEDGGRRFRVQVSISEEDPVGP